MAEVKKHPDVIAWEEWINSKEGKKCLSTDILRDQSQGGYLMNRLWYAFQAGIKQGKLITK